MRLQVSVSSSSSSHDKEKGNLGESPPGLSTKEALLVTLRTEIGPSGAKSRLTGTEIPNRDFKIRASTI